MSGSGDWSTFSFTPSSWEPPPPPAPPPPKRRLFRWSLVLSGVLVVGSVVAAAVLVLGEDEGPSFPDEWDPKVLEFVDIVEDARDLDFEHPIAVDFLDDDTFRAEVTAEVSELTDEDREQLDQFTGLFRAAGLIEGELDLFEATNELYGEGTIGLYSYEDKRITMRGTELTPARRSTLVHELTHALQDQHFDLEQRFEDLEDDEAAATAFQAIVEGDASRVETVYTDTLSDEEREALDEDEAAQIDDVASGLEDVPLVLQTFLGAPYALGEVLLDIAIEVDGNDAVDEIFVDPPRSEEQLLDPWALLDDDDPVDVDTPELEAGEEEFYTGPFGVFTLYLMLAERIGPPDALVATDGWGGDAMVGFERHGVSCFRAEYLGDTEGDVDELEDALERWSEPAPEGTASVERTGDALRFESCDPGSAAGGLGDDISDDALSLVLIRSVVARDLLSTGATEAQAQCFAAGVITEFGMEVVNDPTLAEVPDAQDRILPILAGC